MNLTDVRQPRVSPPCIGLSFELRFCGLTSTVATPETALGQRILAPLNLMAICTRLIAPFPLHCVSDRSPIKQYLVYTDSATKVISTAGACTPLTVSPSWRCYPRVANELATDVRGDVPGFDTIRHVLRQILLVRVDWRRCVIRQV